ASVPCSARRWAACRARLARTRGFFSSATRVAQEGLDRDFPAERRPGEGGRHAHPCRARGGTDRQHEPRRPQCLRKRRQEIDSPGERLNEPADCLRVRGGAPCRQEASMPKVKVNGITMNYERQGEGDPLLLIPYLAADNACYAFQVAAYEKHYTCISIDPRGAGESDKPEGVYSTELFADDVAAFMQAVGIKRAHVAGLSLGAAIGMWLAAKHP